MILTEYNSIDTQLKDQYFFYRICQIASKKFICEKTRGLSIHFINKYVSTILRHWAELQTCGNFHGLYNWGLKTIPYRYGNVVIAPSQKRVEFQEETTLPNREFVETYIKNSEILKRLGCIALNKNGKNLFIFPTMNPKTDSEIFEKAGLNKNPSDTSFLDYLSNYYIDFSVKDLCCLSTCPNEISCFHSIYNELLMWIYDIDQLNCIVQLIIDTNKQQPKLMAQLNSRILYAYNCLNQIEKKVSWYNELPLVKKKILDLSGHEEIISPLLNSLDDCLISERIKRGLYCSNLASGFLGILYENLNICGLKLTLPDKVIHDIESKKFLFSELQGNHYPSSKLRIEKDTLYQRNRRLIIDEIFLLYKDLLNIFSLNNLPSMFDSKDLLISRIN